MAAAAINVLRFDTATPLNENLLLRGIVGRTPARLEWDVVRGGALPRELRLFDLVVARASASSAAGSASAGGAGSPRVASASVGFGGAAASAASSPSAPRRPRRLGGLALGRLFLVDRADVVALLVVGVLAEVVLVLGRDDAALGGLLDRQRDAAAVEVDVDDLHPQLFAGGDDLLGRLDVVHGHLGDVHEAFDAFADLDERAERARAW